MVATISQPSVLGLYSINLTVVIIKTWKINMPEITRLFLPLKDPALFKSVQVEQGGLCNILVQRY